MKLFSTLFRPKNVQIPIKTEQLPTLNEWLLKKNTKLQDSNIINLSNSEKIAAVNKQDAILYVSAKNIDILILNTLKEILLFFKNNPKFGRIKFDLSKIIDVNQQSNGIVTFNDLATDYIKIAKTSLMQNQAYYIAEPILSGELNKLLQNLQKLFEIRQGKKIQKGISQFSNEEFKKYFNNISKSSYILSNKNPIKHKQKMTIYYNLQERKKTPTIPLTALSYQNNKLKDP